MARRNPFPGLPVEGSRLNVLCACFSLSGSDRLWEFFCPMLITSLMSSQPPSHVLGLCPQPCELPGDSFQILGTFSSPASMFPAHGGWRAFCTVATCQGSLVPQDALTSEDHLGFVFSETLALPTLAIKMRLPL